MTKHFNRMMREGEAEPDADKKEEEADKEPSDQKEE